MISFVFPTRARHDIFRNTIQHMLEHCDSTNNFEIIIKIDEDEDAQFYADILCKLNHKIIQADRGRGYIDLMYPCNMVATMSSGEYIWVFGDDLDIQTPGWDTKIIRYGNEQKQVFRNGIFFMYALDTARRKPMMGFPIVPRKFVDLLGFLYKDEHGDSFTTTIAIHLDRAVILRDLILGHNRSRRWGGYSKQEIESTKKKPFDRLDAIGIAEYLLKDQLA